MKIKYSALVSATSGKLNGSVAASNRGGAYLRNKGVVSNPQTVSQQLNRSQFGAISSQFRALTPAQIAAWNTAAQDFPVIDRFGDTRYLSGLALYVQLNKNLASIGAALISDPPVKQAFPETTAASASIVVLNGDFDGFTFLVEFNEIVSASFVMEVRATPGISPSISYVKNKFRNIGNTPGTGVNEITFSGTAGFQSNFGVPAVGQKVVLEFTLVSTVSGERSAPFIVETLVSTE